MLLKYFFLVPCLSLLLAKVIADDETFSLSLNEAKSDQEQWAEANAGMPALEELTVCHWEKISYFNKQFANIWSYCVKISEHFGGITCMQYFSGIDQEEHDGGKTYIFLIRFQNSSNQEYIRIKNYQERQWNHICWRSNSNGDNHYFINGEIRHKFYYPLVVIPSDKKEESAFLIGQEPDTLRNNFYNLEAYRGKISGFNLWNFTLTDVQIIALAKCKTQLKGNVIKWEQTAWKFTNTSPKLIDTSEMCSNPKQHFLFPFQTSFDEASHICKIHGGDLVVPENADENEKLMTMIKPFLENCDPLGKSVGAWLGITRSGNKMVQKSRSGEKSLNFSNWDMSPMTIDSCVVFLGNGMWDSKNKMFCPRIKTCPVCSFTNVPKLTMIGLCSESPVDYYWYLAKDDTGVVHYDGYKDYKAFSFNDFKIWKVSSNEDESIAYNIAILNGPDTPVGLNFLNASDSSCNIQPGVKMEISLSVCVLGREFACGSGECVSKYKRCDNAADCSDHTDEENCKTIMVPAIYDKSKSRHWARV